VRSSRIQETEVAANVISYLGDLHWECFSEVTYNHARADIIARQGRLIWIIETKITFGLPVIEQARRWVNHANFVSVATPSVPKEFGREVCRLFGIGILFANGIRTEERLRAKLNRRPISVPKLCEEHKTYAPAGTNGGGYFTPFNRTCRDTLAVAKREPNGIPLKRLIDLVDHHYVSNSTARNCMRNWIKWGKVPGVELRMVNGKAIIFPTEAT